MRVFRSLKAARKGGFCYSEPMITFITGNAGKYNEAVAVLGSIELSQQKLHLPEVQGLDPREVLRAKLLAAKAEGVAPCIVEDSSLTLSCLNDQLPGPFIKWFEDALGIQGLYELTKKYEDDRAIVHTHIGYLDEAGEMHLFDAKISGRIVLPRGDKDFGYGPIFLPDGSDKTFGEMERAEKQEISSRAMAFRALRDFLLAGS
ncbi:MAG: inosine triphosphate pyrophosphatase [Parcubacteria bacterium C7867-004]|nr:MAG: inosine triphosphate pyrophosphatase [Parcubacteria bacterium C7867-004]